ncbi:MAG: hypothetical protein MUE51_07360 [Thermoleophilia bacterium]|jgi:hypothetical protein|nr:hypothetical protein [Thermoleophilia bacterium]
MSDETTEATEAPEAVEDEAAEAEGAVATATAVAEPEAPEAEDEAPAPAAEAGPKQARLYLCERGHRTTVLWSEPPTTCHARPLRHGPECGRPVYHSTELPEQVVKALNPLKASKKASKKK